MTNDVFNELYDELNNLISDGVSYDIAIEIIKHFTETAATKSFELTNYVVFLGDEDIICIEFHENGKSLYFDIDESNSRFFKAKKTDSGFLTENGEVTKDILSDLGEWFFDER